MPPWCDAVVLDIKFFANLDSNPANDPTVGLPNSGRMLDKMVYKLLAYKMGAYDTMYDVGGSKFLVNKINPEVFDYTTLWPNIHPGDSTNLSLEYSWPSLRKFFVLLKYPSNYRVQ
eukprot:gene42301-52574_t